MTNPCAGHRTAAWTVSAMVFDSRRTLAAPWVDFSRSLRIPPGNQLEALKADRRGAHSIRINDQWRICFVWKPDGAYRVEIVDYH